MEKIANSIRWLETKQNPALDKKDSQVEFRRDKNFRGRILLGWNFEMK
jgi:hypothetical protein